MNDDELEKHFDALRTIDEQSAPSFHALRARKTKTKVPVWAWALGGLTLSASVPLALLTYIAIKPTADQVRPSEMIIPRVLLADSEPLAFLLHPIPALEGTP